MKENKKKTKKEEKKKEEETRRTGPNPAQPDRTLSPFPLSSFPPGGPASKGQQPSRTSRTTVGWIVLPGNKERIDFGFRVLFKTNPI